MRRLSKELASVQWLILTIFRSSCVFRKKKLLNPLKRYNARQLRKVLNTKIENEK